VPAVTPDDRLGTLVGIEVHQVVEPLAAEQRGNADRIVISAGNDGTVAGAKTPDHATEQTGGEVRLVADAEQCGVDWVTTHGSSEAGANGGSRPAAPLAIFCDDDGAVGLGSNSIRTRSGDENDGSATGSECRIKRAAEQGSATEFEKLLGTAKTS